LELLLLAMAMLLLAMAMLLLAMAMLLLAMAMLLLAMERQRVAAGKLASFVRFTWTSSTRDALSSSQPKLPLQKQSRWRRATS
jgi:hypothetical protein